MTELDTREQFENLKRPPGTIPDELSIYPYEGTITIFNSDDIQRLNTQKSSTPTYRILKGRDPEMLKRLSEDLNPNEVSILKDNEAVAEVNLGILDKISTLLASGLQNHPPL